METFFNYLLQANLILVLAYLYYKIGLRNARPQLDRIYLLGSVFAAFTFPAIHISIGSFTPSEEPAFFFLQNIPSIIPDGSTLQATASGLLWYEWLYLAPAILLITFSLWSFTKIMSKAFRQPRVQKPGYTLVVGTGIGPASFGRFLFWEGDTQFQRVEDQMILAHELGHIRQGHTYDLVLFEVLRALCWFNPVVFLMYREMRQTHEFLADANVLNEAPREDLSRLIASQALGVPALTLANHFSSHTKKRILMLRRSNRKGSIVMYMLSIPLLAFIFCSTSIAQQPGMVKKKKMKTESADAANYVMPQALNMGEVRQKIGYPKAAAKKGIEGKVIMGILVDKEGNVAEAKVVGNAPKELIDAVASHIEELKFTPGTKDGVPVKTKLKLPFKFELAKEATE